MIRFALLLVSLISRHSDAGFSTLDGLWRQDCHGRTVRSEDFHGPRVVYQEIHFADADCTRALLKFRIEGPFSVQGNFMDFRFESDHISLSDPAVVDDFNRRRVCGWSDWTLAAEREISGLHCDFMNWGTPMPVPPAGTLRFGIWRVESDRLFFGKLTVHQDGTSPARRPSSWDPRFYRKIH